MGNYLLDSDNLSSCWDCVRDYRRGEMTKQDRALIADHLLKVYEIILLNGGYPYHRRDVLMLIDNIMKASNIEKIQEDVLKFIEEGK